VPYAFIKSFQKADHTRRFTIRSTSSGWEVRQEEDDRVIRESRYDDWHRVEQLRRTFSEEFSALRARGWRELPGESSHSSLNR
jgi:hypothetical protein